MREHRIEAGSELAKALRGRDMGELMDVAGGALSLVGDADGLREEGDRLTRDLYAAVADSGEAEKAYLISAVALNLATCVFVAIDSAEFSEELESL